MSDLLLFRLRTPQERQACSPVVLQFFRLLGKSGFVVRTGDKKTWPLLWRVSFACTKRIWGRSDFWMLFSEFRKGTTLVTAIWTKRKAFCALKHGFIRCVKIFYMQCLNVSHLYVSTYFYCLFMWRGKYTLCFRIAKPLGLG